MPLYFPEPAELRWLARALELKSFSAAAREQNVAVSVVTRAIGRLEAGYGVTLVRRSTHGLSATPEGALLAREAHELLTRMEDVAASLSKQKGRVAGTVRLATSQEICESLVVPHLARLRSRHPALRLELLAEDRVVDLATDGIDVALRSTIGNSESVVARELGKFQRRLYAAPGYLREQGEPRSPHDLVEHRLITHTSQGSAPVWHFEKAGRPLEVSVRSHLAASTTALVHRALIAGAGIGLLSTPLAAADVAKGDLVEVLPSFSSAATYTMFAVSLPDRRSAARVRAVIDFLHETALEHW